MSYSEVKSKYPTLTLRNVNDSGVLMGWIFRDDTNPNQDVNDKLESLKGIDVSFVKERLIYFKLDYEEQPSIKSWEEFASKISEAFKLPKIPRETKLRSRTEKPRDVIWTLGCTDFEVYVSFNDDSRYEQYPSVSFTDTTRDVESYLEQQKLEIERREESKRRQRADKEAREKEERVKTFRP